MKTLWERWKKIAKTIGHYQAVLLLSILYYSIIAPFAFLVKLKFGHVHKPAGKNSNWYDWYYDEEKRSKEQ